MPHPRIAQFEQLIRRDPARRGLIGTEELFGSLCAGHLEQAAEHLARFGKHVGLVTGFYVGHGDPPAAETDGPLGTLLLAAALEQADISTTVLTDEHCAAAVMVCAMATEYPPENVLIYPDDSDLWLTDFFTSGRGRSLSHLISIERAGPSHTLESVNGQHRQSRLIAEDFETEVPVSSRNRCHNMRGEIIDEQTADMHRLFEEICRYRPEAKTIGIGDGANEIGMGSIPWEELRRRLDGQQAARIPCRVATDWTIVAGTSNWGGYALAAATLTLLDRIEILRPWGRAHQLAVLEEMVQQGPAVDGVTGRQEATVDGLPFMTYIQPWDGIRQLLGFDD